jgi:tRNA nucleotidyltransferase (CCA-adding enzyme)
MDMASRVAGARHESLYLVGGVVRDLLLGRLSLDLDLVLEGDAVGLAGEVGGEGERVVVYRRFGTATIRGEGFSLDFVTARGESYARPGALPKVWPGSIGDDLSRRDFSINAMAIALSEERYGELIDPWGGMKDLDRGVIRVLHERSFMDDATRMLRAVRYEGRFGFRMDGSTEGLLRRDIPWLDAISGDRLRHELERIFQEEYPEHALARADELGVLPRLHPSLRGNGWLAGRFREARGAGLPSPAPLYLWLLLYRLKSHELEEVLARLKLSRTIARTARDAILLRERLGTLSERDILPSRVHGELSGYTSQAVLVSSVACDDPLVKGRLRLFLDRLRHVRPSLKGDDLVRLGARPGPDLRELLGRLRDARLDGQVTTRAGEMELARRLVSEACGPRGVD